MEQTHTTAWRRVDKEGLCFQKGRHAAEAALGLQRAAQATGAEVTKREKMLGLVGLSEALSEEPTAGVGGVGGCMECSDLTDGPSLATSEAEEHNADTQSTGGSGIPGSITLALGAVCLRALG